MKILVVCGGNSSEKEVSLNTGRAIFEALKANFSDVDCMECLDKKSCLESIIKYNPDKVFIALHGGFGENGELQAALDMVGIDYTSSSFEASCIAMNKFAAKSIFQKFNIPTAQAQLVRTLEDIEKIDFFPICIKPNKEGSSVGVEFAYNKQDAIDKYLSLHNKFDELIAEKKLEGREITITILKETVYPIIEIKPKKGFYNYENKYTKGATEYIVPAKIEKEIETLCKEIAHRAYKAIGCSGCARVDLILTDNVPFVLEINTIPGMTQTSLVPQSAKASGVTFEEFVKKIVMGG